MAENVHKLHERSSHSAPYKPYTVRTRKHFFGSKPKDSWGFLGPDSMGFVWGGVGRALMQFMHVFGHFCYVGGFCDLGDPLWYPL